MDKFEIVGYSVAAFITIVVVGLLIVYFVHDANIKAQAEGRYCLVANGNVVYTQCIDKDGQ